MTTPASRVLIDGINKLTAEKGKLTKKGNEQRREIRRLLSEVKHLKADIDSYVKSTSEQAAEAKRLRDALAPFATMNDEHKPLSRGTTSITTTVQLRDIDKAKDALK